MSPAHSKVQARFMGLVHAVQKGKVSSKKVSARVKKAAKSMTQKQTAEFARGSSKGLPTRIKAKKKNLKKRRKK